MEFNLDSLAVLKLMNGEVIVCEIVSEDESQITIRYAIQAFMNMINEIPLLNFVQWIPFTDDLIVLYRHGILAASVPSDDIKHMYLEKMTEFENETEAADSASITDDIIPGFRHQCRNSRVVPNGNRH